MCLVLFPVSLLGLLAVLVVFRVLLLSEVASSIVVVVRVVGVLFGGVLCRYRLLVAVSLLARVLVVLPSVAARTSRRLPFSLGVLLVFRVLVLWFVCLSGLLGMPFSLMVGLSWLVLVVLLLCLFLLVVLS